MHSSTLTRRLITIAVAALLLIASTSSAQQTTERYIPIGESPGLSEVYTYLGEIIAVDGESRTLTVRDSDGPHVVQVTDSTEIWLDSTALGRSNATASFADCEVGRKVEIMHTQDDEYTAAWIKISAD